MTGFRCRYTGDREHAIVSYLYGDDAEFDGAERAAFEEHLATCGQCRREVDAFTGVRASLAEWSPPNHRPIDHGLPEPFPSAARSTTGEGGPWWRVMPVWAQTAAALLCMGAAAGLANLDVRYGADGFQVRTGWLASPVQNASGVATDGTGEAPWRADLTAVEQRVRSDLRAVLQTPAGPPAVAAAPAASPDTLRRVRALIEESERRQQSELALRLAEAVRDMNAQRQADLVRIDRNIGLVQNTTGREMMRQRSEMLNYLTVRTASQRPQ